MESAWKAISLALFSTLVTGVSSWMVFWSSAVSYGEMQEYVQNNPDSRNIAVDSAKLNTKLDFLASELQDLKREVKALREDIRMK